MAAMFASGGGLPNLPPPQHAFPPLPPPGMGMGPAGLPDPMHPPFPGTEKAQCNCFESMVTKPASTIKSLILFKIYLFYLNFILFYFI